MFILGIDGGGTKTEAVLLNEKAHVLGYWKGGPCNVATLSEDSIAIVIRSLLNNLIGEVDIAVFGLAGAGRRRHVEKAAKAISRVLKAKDLVIVSDAEIALFSSTLFKPGILIIAGTGSAAFALDSAGKIYRCGGLGYLLDDEGSGYWIGLKVLQTVAKILDEREKPSPILERTLSFLKVRCLDELVDLAYSELSVAKIASLAEIALELFEEDPYCHKIIEEACKELALLAKCVANKAGIHLSSIYCQGGLFNSDIFMKLTESMLTEVFRKKMKLKKPRFKPVVGALLLAWKKLGLDLDFLLSSLKKYSFLLNR